MLKKIHYCACRLNLAGQNCHTVVYDEFNPVTWPEVQVLMALHAEENVMDIRPVSIGETYPGQEKERLMQIYGRIVEQCFPGRNFRMEMLMTGDEQLPAHVEGQASTKIDPPSNGDDDEDDGEDEVAKAMAEATAAAPVFKPGRHRPTPAAVPKEA